MAVGNADGAEERRELAIRMQIAGAKGTVRLLCLIKWQGSRADRGQPVGDIVRIADRSGEKQQSRLRRTKDDGFFPDDPPFRIRDDIAIRPRSPARAYRAARRSRRPLHRRAGCAEFPSS